LRGFPRRKIGPSAVVIGIGVFRVDFNHFSVVGNDAVLLAQIVAPSTPFDKRKSAEPVGKGVCGMEFDRFGVVGDRPVVVALHTVDHTTAAVGRRPVIVAPYPVGDAAPDVSDRRLSIQLNCLGVVGDRPVI